jgi:rSAM/selenodomain-associated transferase 1
MPGGLPDYMSSKTNDRSDIVVMVFAKAPVPGKVKTRLGRSLGMRRASSIYQKMLFQFLEKLTATNTVTLQLWCYPDTRHPFFRKCARELNVSLRRQQGFDLGSRMLHAFRTNRSYHFSILTGSDIPGIDVLEIEQSVSLLQDKMDVVFLPTEDGGYGLVAMTRPYPELFCNMVWSTEKVLRQTLSRANRRGLVYSLLDSMPDIDKKSDYITYKNRPAEKLQRKSVGRQGSD